MAKQDVAKRQEQQEERERRPIRPVSSIYEEEGRIVLRLEMPGVRKEGLEINVEQNQLMISGRRPEPQPEGRYLVKERIDGDFYQVYTLDETIDREKIDASLNGGVLTVRLNLREEEKPRRIEVKVG